MTRFTFLLSSCVIILLTTINPINSQNIKPVYSETKKAYGAINDKGETIIPYEYVSLKRDKYFFIATTKQKKYVFFKPDGHRITDSVFDEIRMIKPGIYGARWQHLWALLSQNSITVRSNFPLIIYDDILAGNRNGIVIKAGGKYGLITDDENIIIRNELDNPPSLPTKGHYICLKENKLGCIDTLGREVIPFILNEQKVSLEYKEALPLIERLLRIDPANEDVLYLACIGKFKNSGSAEALAYMDGLMSPLGKEYSKFKNPEFAHYFKTLIYTDLKDFEKAVMAKSMLKSSNDCSSYWVKASIYLGNGYFKSGDYPKAHQTYTLSSKTCEQSQKYTKMAARELAISTSSNPSERNGIWITGGGDPFPSLWDQKLSEPAKFLQGHFNEQKGLNVQYTQADCGCDFSRKEPAVLDIYCFASYKAGTKNINEQTVAFEMPVTEFKISKIERTSFWGTDTYYIYLNSALSGMVVTFNPDAGFIRTKIDKYELEKSGNVLAWGHKF
jgi:tetratricopeptide (TPR) repeat protein